MIDTIGIQFPFAIKKTNLNGWEYFNGGKKNGFVIWHRLSIPTSNGAEVTYTYYPYVLHGLPLLKIEFSLPHLLYGNNISLVVDLKAGLDKANKILPHVPGIPAFDIWEGELYRIDFCYNHHVGEQVPWYIPPLQHLEISRRKTGPYTSEGVEYFNKQVSSKFYNKEKESKNLLAHGILRQETTHRKAAVKRLTGQKHPTLKDIATEMPFDKLEGDLKVLGLDNRSIGSYDSTLKLLCAIYGSAAGLYYFGLLTARVEFPSREIVSSECRIHPRSLDRRLKKILEAGSPLTLTNAIHPLPPLVIDRKMVISHSENRLDSCYCHEVIGDTRLVGNRLIGKRNRGHLCQL